jgi:hypothetical protein
VAAAHAISAFSYPNELLLVGVKLGEFQIQNRTLNISLL